MVLWQVFSFNPQAENDWWSEEAVRVGGVPGSAGDHVAIQTLGNTRRQTQVGAQRFGKQVDS